jgi:hypothetical protein
MHFNSLREQRGGASMGMRKPASVGRCAIKYSERNLVSRVCWCAARNDRPDATDR